MRRSHQELRPIVTRSSGLHTSTWLQNKNYLLDSKHQRNAVQCRITAHPSSSICSSEHRTPTSTSLRSAAEPPPKPPPSLPRRGLVPSIHSIVSTLSDDSSGSVLGTYTCTRSCSTFLLVYIEQFKFLGPFIEYVRPNNLAKRPNTQGHSCSRETSLHDIRSQTSQWMNTLVPHCTNSHKYLYTTA